MKFIADFHLHSKYSRATSKEADLENLAKWAKIKGIQVLGTGDFTHPAWLKELKEKLEPAEAGLFRIKNSRDEARFILTGEISCIYSKNGKVRKIHIIIFSPSFEITEKINTHLSWIGNLKSDGRPILGLDAKELAKIALGASSQCLIVPAHIWTPWFSIFGSKSGFNSVEECFEELASHIFAMETGLSSDPAMNWRLSTLDKYTLISNSDAHSGPKLGREANVFEGNKLSYEAIARAIKKGGREYPDDSLKLVSTIEFFPEEGKYHFDGHRLCNVRFSPEETKKYGGICPNCGKPVTVGVMSRVEELADRPAGAKPKTAVPFLSLVPLQEIIAESFSQEVYSKSVQEEYQKLISCFENEFKILIEVPIEEIKNVSLKVAEGIKRMRDGKVKLIPGYDGEFGKVLFFQGEEEKKAEARQKRLF